MNTLNCKLLSEKFGIDKILAFHESDNGTVRADITTATCSAQIYMQGAHLTQWQPSGHKPVVFLSSSSSFAPGKAIRGGVPLIFPWFGARKANSTLYPNSPAHGFARTSNDWRLTEASLSGDDLLMSFELTENEVSKSFGYADFKLTYKVAVGQELELELIVENNSGETMEIEEAFHTYIEVSDAEHVSLSGLHKTDYLDKTDNMKRKTQSETVLNLAGETDRPYLNTESKIEVDDKNWQRRVTIDKLNSQSTVIWNPWKDLAAKMSDLEVDGWKRFVCVETANIGDNVITLPAGRHHAMHARVFVSAL